MKLHFPSNQTLVWFVASLLLMLVGLAVIANAQIPPPVCPSKDCSKVITFYNNTPTAIFPVIQAGIQNPDPWLQALFNDNTKTYAETHYSRAYINPVNGIPPGGHVSVTVPWYSQLSQDVDQFIDWYNGGRIYIFDSAAALSTAHKADKDSPLSLTSSSPVVSCEACEAAADDLQRYTRLSAKYSVPTGRVHLCRCRNAGWRQALYHRSKCR